MIISSADVNVSTDIVTLNLHSHMEEAESLLEAALALQRVADVVEQLGVAMVHLEPRHEDLILVQPVVISYVGLRRVNRQECQQKNYRQFFTVTEEQNASL